MRLASLRRVAWGWRKAVDQNGWRSLEFFGGRVGAHACISSEVFPKLLGLKEIHYEAENDPQESEYYGKLIRQSVKLRKLVYDCGSLCRNDIRMTHAFDPRWLSSIEELVVKGRIMRWYNFTEGLENLKTLDLQDYQIYHASI